jgi:hypothetical protein
MTPPLSAWRWDKRTSDLHHCAMPCARQKRIATFESLRGSVNTKVNDRSRRPNGTTQTFRRPTNQVSNPSNPFQSRDSTNSSQNRNSSETVGVYIPPHRNSTSSDGSRFSKEHLLDLFRKEQAAGNIKDGIAGLYVNGWEPNIANGSSATSWGRRDDSKDGQAGADICWARDGRLDPMALSELTEDEKEVRTAINCSLPKLTLHSFSSLQSTPLSNLQLNKHQKKELHETELTESHQFLDRIAQTRLASRHPPLDQDLVVVIQASRSPFPHLNHLIQELRDTLEMNLMVFKILQHHFYVDALMLVKNLARRKLPKTVHQKLTLGLSA